MTRPTVIQTTFQTGGSMILKPLSILMLAAVAAGCASADRHERGDGQGSTNAITREECADQRDACLGRNQVIGLLICPIQFEQCVATASDGIPAQVAGAIEDTAMCARTGTRCRVGSEGGEGALAC